MTTVPARVFGLVDQGALREGAFANLVVLDRDTVVDHAGLESPMRHATAIRVVVVNGAPSGATRLDRGAARSHNKTRTDRLRAKGQTHGNRRPGEPRDDDLAPP